MTIYIMNQLPYEISYDITIMPLHMEQEIIEGWEKIDYKLNARDIIKSRFRGDGSHIPGLNEVFEQMAISMQSKTPLGEYEKRCQKLNSPVIVNGKHSNLPQLKESK